MLPLSAARFHNKSTMHSWIHNISTVYYVGCTKKLFHIEDFESLLWTIEIVPIWMIIVSSQTFDNNFDDSIYIKWISYKSIVFFVNALWIHYLYGDFTLIHYSFNDLTLNSLSFPSIFLKYCFREFTINLISLSQIHFTKW